MAINPALTRMLGQAANKYKGGGGNKAAKPGDGRTQIRLLIDPSKPLEQFWQDSAVHWIKADVNGKPLVVVGDCDTVFQQPSVIKAAIQMAIDNATDEDSKELFESWKEKKSVIFPVIIRPETDTPVLMELTPTTFGKIMDLITMYATSLQDPSDPNSGIDITDLNAGMDIIITKTGKGLNTSYDVAIAPAGSKPVPADVFTKMPDALEYVKREFFRGEEQKALNAIQQIAGIAVPRLANTAATPTAALTAPSAVVPDATVAAPVAPVAVATPAPAPASVAPPAQDNDIAAQIAALQAQQAALVKTQAAPAPVAEAEPETASPMLSESDADAILAELDQLK